MKTFAELNAELKALVEEEKKFEADINTKFDTELKAAIWSPRRKTPYSRKLAQKVLGDHYPIIFQKYQLVVTGKFAETSERRKVIEAEMFKSVEAEGIQPSAEPVLVHSVCEHAYQSQGYGARKYARGAATLSMLELEAVGVKAEVREIPHKYDWGTLLYYEVWAWTSEPEKYRFLPSKLTMRDAAKACWRMNCNPKVIYPFLDHATMDETCNEVMAGK